MLNNERPTMGDAFFGHGFEDAWTAASFDNPKLQWVAEALSWEYDVKFAQPIFGNWDHGSKSGGTFTMRPSVMDRAVPGSKRTRKVAAIEVGSWELNYFERLAVEDYGSISAFKSAVARRFNPKKATNGVGSWDTHTVYTHLLTNADQVLLFGLKGGEVFRIADRSWRTIAQRMERFDMPGFAVIGGPPEPEVATPNPFFEADATYKLKQLVSAQHMAMTVNMRDFYFPEEGKWVTRSQHGNLLVENPYF